MNDHRDNTMRVDLPPVGGAGCSIALVIFVAFFLGVAGYNLLHSPGLPPLAIGGSVLWICIVVLWVVGGVRSVGGPRRAVVRCLGVFARKAFVEVRRSRNGTSIFRYAFEFRGRDYEYQSIEVAQIETVDWSTGQASDMRGFDCNDWTVAVWYWKSDDAGSSHSGLIDPNRDLIIITPHLTKLQAISVGRPVGEMLIAAELPLRLRDDDRGFYRSDQEHSD